MPGNFISDNLFVKSNIEISNKSFGLRPFKFPRFIINVCLAHATTLCAQISRLSIKRFSIASLPTKSIVIIPPCSTTGINNNNI